MAEIAVNLLIDKLGPSFLQEVKLLSGVQGEIKGMKDELECIRYFLKDAEVKAATKELQANSSDGVQQWLTQVREVAYRIEDVIDEFAIIVAQLPHGRGLVGLLQKISCFIKKLKLRHNIAYDIGSIKSSLKDIVDRKNLYKLEYIDDRSSGPMRRGDSIDPYYVEPDQVVGHESTRDELRGLLANKTPQRKVIALVGAGGLGKTTLAANVYKNSDVKSQFNCHAWIMVGKSYTTENLLRKMTQKFYGSMEESPPSNLETMDKVELTEVLRRYLNEKAYLIVFDDIWEVGFWKDVEHALLDNNKSSRIIITTREKKVAEFIPNSIVHIFLLQPFPSDKAWELFCKKAFGPDKFCPVELKELSSEILKKCGGLPLAIAAIGSLLSNKNKSPIEWEKLLKNLGSTLISDHQLQECNKVLYESYNDLPYHLKTCLLYFGIFPEGYSISTGKLVRLWIAEGFIQQTDKILPEQVAKGYLMELIQRCLIQVPKTRPNGGIRKCQVHDLMYDIIIRKTKELGFNQVLSEQGDTSQQKTTRRITIYKKKFNVLESITDLKVRSVFVFDGHERFIRQLIANFKLMKVLVFEDAPLHHVPKEVGNLFHLHYLSLRNTKVKTFPKSICKLLNLEFLDLRGTFVRELPHEIKYLKKLRSLLIYTFNWTSFNCGRGTKLPKGFVPFADMQKLSYVLANSEVFKELKNLRQMKTLGINLDEGTGEDLCDCIKNMENLNRLYLELGNIEMSLDIQPINSFPQSLERFTMVGKLKKLPNWISSLQSLYSISLYNSCLTDDPMKVLYSLPNLLVLFLRDSYIGEQFHIKGGWFPKLQRLYLVDLKGLKFIMIEDGALPALRMLSIQRCQLVKEIPKGIKHLRSLKILRFRDMLRDLITYDNLNQLKHVQNVSIHIEGKGYIDVQSILDIFIIDSCPSTEVEDTTIINNRF